MERLERDGRIEERTRQKQVKRLAEDQLVFEVTLVARRDITAGEEITMDQGTWNFDETEYTVDAEDCTCGSPDCRRVLTENDWKLEAVQERYKGHFHPYVQAMIDRG